jgi:hypothetical protein
MQEKLEKILHEIANLKSMFNRHEERLNTLEGKSEIHPEEPTAYEDPSKNIPEEDVSSTTIPFD